MIKSLLRKLGYPRYDLKKVCEDTYDLHKQRFPLDKWKRLEHITVKEEKE